MAWKGLIDRYGDRMAIDGLDDPVTLCEGNTPLIPAPRLGEWAGGCDLYLKYEGVNPTGSFKDRGMTTAITHAKANEARAVICASTGNTSASAAAYAARAGLRCVVLIPDGKIAMGKLAGTIAYGAEVVAIQGSFDDALRMVREIADVLPIALVNSVNPARLEGQKTGAWEVVDQLGGVPDWLTLPVGNAGNISAYWMGFQEANQSPRILGTQAAGAAPIVTGIRVDRPETRATAIRIGNPARWQQALDALRESNGQIFAASDEEIFEAYHQVARLEGIFCEPSSAASIAGLRKTDVRGKTVVAVLTGHGLKDPDSAIVDAPPLIRIPSTLEALKEVCA